MDQNLQSKIQAAVIESARVFNLPSLSVSVSAKGEEYHFATGLADVEANVPATPDTFYSIGSSTKAFIATAVNILAQEGKLSLDEPVKNILPWFKLYDPFMTESLTMRDALSHRSGLPRHDLSWGNTPDRTLRQQVAAMAYFPPAFKPRYRFHYQNHMFVLASQVVEELTGMYWGDFVAQRIFKPLGMNDSYATGDLIADSEPRKARPYKGKEGGQGHDRMEYNYAKSVGGAGTIYSTTRDMLKWLRFRLEGNDSILKKELLEDMHLPQMIIRSGEMSPIEFDEITFTSYCQAWFTESYRGFRTVHHGGTINGFKSEQIFAPEHQLAVSSLSNMNGTPAMSAICYMILDILLGLEPIDWNARYKTANENMMAKMKAAAEAQMAEARKTAAGKCADPAAYAGTFSHPGYGEIKVEVKDGAVAFALFGELITAEYVKDDSFMLVADRMMACLPISFQRDLDKISAVDIPLESMLPDNPIRFERVK